RMLENDRRAIGFRERVIQFHEPTEPHRTGKGVTPRSEPPCERDEKDEADEGGKEVDVDGHVVLLQVRRLTTQAPTRPCAISRRAGASYPGQAHLLRQGKAKAGAGLRGSPCPPAPPTGSASLLPCTPGRSPPASGPAGRPSPAAAVTGRGDISPCRRSPGGKYPGRLVS